MKGVSMRTLGRIAALGFSLGALAGLPGCLVAAAGAGAAGTAYVLGDLDGTVPGTPQKVAQAAESVLKEMDVPVTSSNATGLDGKVVGRTALDKKVEITVTRVDDKSSKVSIRVGTF